MIVEMLKYIKFIKYFIINFTNLDIVPSKLVMLYMYGFVNEIFIHYKRFELNTK